MNIKSLLILVIVGILACGVASAVLLSDIDLKEVEVNDVELSLTDSHERNNIEKTDELEILVIFSSNTSYDDVEITAELTGYDKNDKGLIEDTTNAFDVKANQT